MPEEEKRVDGEGSGQKVSVEFVCGWKKSLALTIMWLVVSTGLGVGEYYLTKCDFRNNQWLELLGGAAFAVVGVAFVFCFMMAFLFAVVFLEDLGRRKR